jgi:hypothetical protein
MIFGGGGEGGIIQYKMQRLSETFLILRRIQGDIITNANKCSCKVPIILVRLYGNQI